MSDLEEIEQLSNLITDKFNSANTYEDWMEANSLWNELGQLIEEYRKSVL